MGYPTNGALFTHFAESQRRHGDDRRENDAAADDFRRFEQLAEDGQRQERRSRNDSGIDDVADETGDADAARFQLSACAVEAKPEKCGDDADEERGETREKTKR